MAGTRHERENRGGTFLCSAFFLAILTAMHIFLWNEKFNFKIKTIYFFIFTFCHFFNNSIIAIFVIYSYKNQNEDKALILLF